MTNEEKTVTAGIAIGAFLLGWFLHKAKPVTGDVVLHFIPTSVQYDIPGVLNSTYSPADETLAPGDYTVNMHSIGG